MVAIDRRRLGTSDLEISAVGFGAWAAGGGEWRFGWGPQDDAASIAAILHAVDLGVNWIDTAAVYGLGHSEAVVGRALQQVPKGERPMVFTKCGRIGDRTNPHADLRTSLRPDVIRRECDESLRRLGVERLDLYQFHWPDPGVPVEESWGTMLELIGEGKVRAAGVCNFDVALLERCEPVRHVDSLQPPFSLIRRSTAEQLLPWCVSHGCGVIVYSPMQSGLLTDRFTAERVGALAEDDWRRRSELFQEPNLSRNLALRDALRPLAERRGVPVAAVAVAWTLAWPGVTGAIVGARSPAQVNGWVRAGAVELTPSDLDEIAEAIRSAGAGSGPERPVQAAARR